MRFYESTFTCVLILEGDVIGVFLVRFEFTRVLVLITLAASFCDGVPALVGTGDTNFCTIVLGFGENRGAPRPATFSLSNVISS